MLRTPADCMVSGSIITSLHWVRTNADWGSDRVASGTRPKTSVNNGTNRLKISCFRQLTLYSHLLYCYMSVIFRQHFSNTPKSTFYRRLIGPMPYRLPATTYLRTSAVGVCGQMWMTFVDNPYKVNLYSDHEAHDYRMSHEKLTPTSLCDFSTTGNIHSVPSFYHEYHDSWCPCRVTLHLMWQNIEKSSWSFLAIDRKVETVCHVPLQKTSGIFTKRPSNAPINGIRTLNEYCVQRV